MSWIDRRAEGAFRAALARLTAGRVCLDLGGDRTWYGPGGGLEATLVVHHPRFFRRALGGDIGLGESYMDGDWTSPDLVPLVRVMLRNLAVLDAAEPAWGVVGQAVATLARRLRDNTLAGSRRNIARHYDLGNEFFALFLDANLLYSCAHYASADDSLEAAQVQKLDLICRKLGLTEADHVLEIGTGWGGFAAWAATRYGCRVTTTTISTQQYAYAARRFAGLGAAGARIDLRLQDYRQLTGTFDHIVSIEMFEAVGYRHYDTFFRACQRLLRPDGAMLLQAITVDDRRFHAYRSSPDWIEKYIFPGSELASVGEVLRSLTRVTTLNLSHLESIGAHYALTLREWRRRFHARIDAVRAMGYDEPFVRMWDLYLAYCEGAFLERTIGDVQLLLTPSRAGARWGDPAPASAAAPAAEPAQWAEPQQATG